MNFEKIIDSKLPSHSKKTRMIMALLGSCAQFARYLHQNCEYESMPNEVLFAISLTTQNMLSLTSDLQCAIPEKELNYIFGEQTQERYYRLSKEISQELSNRFKEDEVI